MKSTTNTNFNRGTTRPQSTASNVRPGSTAYSRVHGYGNIVANKFGESFKLSKHKSTQSQNLKNSSIGRFPKKQQTSIINITNYNLMQNPKMDKYKKFMMSDQHDP